MIDSILTIARLSRLRFARSKMRWLVVLLCAIPVFLAVATAFDTDAAGSAPPVATRWRVIGELGLRSLTLLLPALLLAGALGDEADNRTYTYLWSRPMPRAALLFGKLLAALPMMALALIAAFALSWGIVHATSGEAPEVGWLARTAGAGVAGLVAASAFSIGLGAFFPRHPLIAVLLWVLVLEQILPEVDALRNLVTLHHVRQLAQLPNDDPEGTILGSVLALVLLTVVWLALGIRRVNRVEFSADT